MANKENDILKTLSPNKTNVHDEDAGDILSQLYNIELNTKQSKIDLHELVNRLKNNNEHLNKLLNTLVESNHITKEDLEELLDEKRINPREIVDPIIEELQAVHLDLKLMRLLEGILERLGKEDNNYKWQDEITTLLRQLLQNSQAKEETQKKELESLQQKYADLDSKYLNLESKYADLCNMYTSKYESLQELKAQYDELIDQTKVEFNPNYNALQNVENLHNLKLDQIRVPKQTKKRIVSTPVIHESNESQ